MVKNELLKLMALDIWLVVILDGINTDGHSGNQERSFYGVTCIMRYRKRQQSTISILKKVLIFILGERILIAIYLTLLCIRDWN